MPSKTYCITTNKATNQQQNYHKMRISKQKYTNQLFNLLSSQHTCLSFAAPGTKLDNDKITISMAKVEQGQGPYLSPIPTKLLSSSRLKAINQQPASGSSQIKLPKTTSHCNQLASRDPLLYGTAAGSCSTAVAP